MILCTFCHTHYPGHLQTCPSCGAAVGSQKFLPKGIQQLGDRYTIGKVLGEGGFGITYKGTHTRLQRVVAIKELFPEGANRQGAAVHVPSQQNAEFEGYVAGILQEAQLIASFSSRSIVDVYDVFLANGTAYIVMEYLEGETLLERIERAGKISFDETLEIAISLCDALEEVHDSQLLHRDIKPSNVMLTRDDRIVLIDFGSARQFQIGVAQKNTRMLTPEYAAPEQYSTQANFGPYTDIYCLGTTLFHALTGSLPPDAIERLQGQDQPLNSPAEIHGRLGYAIEAALEVDVSNRPQSIAQFKNMIQPAAQSSSAMPALVGKPLSTDIDHSAQPYEFMGIRHYSSLDLANALGQHWDAALIELTDGALAKWRVREKAGREFKQSLDRVLREPLYSFKQPTPLGIDPDRFHAPIAVLERQLLRTITLLDSRWIPTYRGVELAGLDAVKKWVEDARKDSEAAALLDQCILHGVLLAHPQQEVQEFHQKLVEEHRRCLDHCTKAGGSQHDFNWQKILVYQTGLKRADDAVLKAKQNRDAMRLEWFRTVAFLADSSSGCKVALETLLPLAQEEGRRKRRDQVLWGSVLFGSTLSVGLLVNLLLFVL